MKTRLFAAWLVFKNSVDQVGLGSYIFKVGPLAVLNIVLLTLLFAPATWASMDEFVAFLARHYVYFIPLYALSAGLGYWEIELLDGISESYLLGDEVLFSTRVFQVLAEMIVPATFFSILLIYGHQAPIHLAVLGLMSIAYAVTGIGIGFFAGFKTEKSINNMLNLAIWILGFGPGPFFGEKVESYQFLFPGAHALRGEFILEWLLIVLYTALGVLLVRLGKTPKRYRLYSK